MKTVRPHRLLIHQTTAFRWFNHLQCVSVCWIECLHYSNIFLIIYFTSLASVSLPVSQPNISDYVFVNGSWWNTYFQFGRWHGPFSHFMNFNPYNNTIEGYGGDDVGEFLIHGSYSRNPLQIIVVQSYKVRN